MPNLSSITSIIETYEKHGWILRRVLLSGATKQVVGDTVGGINVTDADIDAAWFSRPPRTGGTAWEIRYLGEVPYALVENIDENGPAFEDDLAALEQRLSDAIRSRRMA